MPNKERKIKKAMTPKEKAIFQDKLRKLILLRNYTKNKLSENAEIKRVQETTDILLADDSKIQDAMLLDLGNVDTIDKDITKLLEVDTKVIKDDEISFINGLEKKQIKELLARGLSIEDIERLKRQVQRNSIPVDPDMLKEEIIISAIENGKLTPLEDDDFQIELTQDAELTSNLMKVSSKETDKKQEDEKKDGFILPGIKAMLLEGDEKAFSKNTPLTEKQMLRKISEQTGYVVIEDENGDLQVSTLEDRMTITSKGGKFDEKYIEMLEKELENEIAKYKRIGMDLSLLEKQLREKLDKRISGTELVMQEDEKDKIVLKAITKQQRKEKNKEVDKEKQEIADSIGVDPSEIISIIRFKSPESFGQIMNMDTNKTNTYVAIRFKNGNFKCYMEEEKKSRGRKSVKTEEGKKTYKEVSDYSVTLVMNQIAPAMKDKSGSGLITDVYAWEAQAGKTNENSNKYDVVQINIAGSNPNDNRDTLIRITTCGKVTVDAVTNHGDGYDFDRNGVEKMYPDGDVVIGSKEYKIHDKETAQKERSVEKEEPNNSVTFYQDIEKRIALLEELMEIDEKIYELENDVLPDVTIIAGKVIGGEGVREGLEYSEESRQVQIDEAVSRRGEILQELGYSESDLEYAKKEAEKMKEAEDEKTIYSNH